MSRPAGESKQEFVYSVLRRCILDGTYPPGYRLVIDAIARELVVSPMPVREAIRRLEAEHWVVYQRHQGAQVAPRDPESWAEAIEALALLEGFVTARAAPHMQPADLDRLRAIDQQMREDVAAVDVMALTDHNEQFHRVIWERCPNRILRRDVERAQQYLNTLRSTIYFPMASRGPASIEEHEQLIAMFEQKNDADAIERFARLHKMRTIEARKRRTDKAT